MISLLFIYSVVATVAHAAKLHGTGAPEQIGLNYGETPSDMVVTWASFSSITTGVCQYGLSSDNLNMTATTTGATYTLGSYVSPMLYRVVLSDLSVGNKVYYYRVGSDETGMSSVYSFKSHPGVGVNGVTFHVFGDLGQTTNSESTLIELNENEEALSTLSGGIISMGDLSYANGDEPLWDTFGNLVQVSRASIPMSTTLGNHEWFDDKSYAFTAYKARFDNPQVKGKEELYYSFNGNIIAMIVIDYCNMLLINFFLI
jgi:hypothetical protein